MAAHARPVRIGKLKNLPVHRLERGSLQPRHAIDGIALKKLAESIQAEGMIQPIFVRKTGRGKFEIVAGERRWHAAKMAGLKRVPTVVSEVSDEEALAIALIENLHREDLNPIDQAIAIRRLIAEFAMTHLEVANTLGKSRAAVTNLLRLLELPADVQNMVADGQLDMGHARAVLALPKEQRQFAADQAANEHLSVRDVERMAKRSSETNSSGHFDGLLPPNSKIPEWVRQTIGKTIKIRVAKDGRCCVSFSFSSPDELRETMLAMSGLVEQFEQYREDRRAKTLHIDNCSGAKEFDSLPREYESLRSEQPLPMKTVDSLSTDLNSAQIEALSSRSN